MTFYRRSRALMLSLLWSITLGYLVLQWVQTSHPTVDEIVEHFNDRNLSDYLVSYARIITSSHLKTHADQFLPFIQGVSIQAFVSAEVEPMGKECDYVQCVALATEFGVPVRIEYLGRQKTAKLEGLTRLLFI